MTTCLCDVGTTSGLSRLQLNTQPPYAHALQHDRPALLLASLTLCTSQSTLWLQRSGHLSISLPPLPAAACCPVNCVGSWVVTGNCTGACSGGSGTLPERFIVTGMMLHLYAICVSSQRHGHHHVDICRQQQRPPASCTGCPWHCSGLCLTRRASSNKGMKHTA
jgi:hypothetical protein